VRYEFESLVGKDPNDWRDNWTRQNNIIDEVFMLYYSINEFWKGSCEINYIRVILCNYNTIE
jgi:hypothetical protein